MSCNTLQFLILVFHLLCFCFTFLMYKYETKNYLEEYKIYDILF